MPTTLGGKAVLITGGSAGIGKAASRLIAEAGASVALVARGAECGQRVEQELRQAGLNVRFLQADVSQSEQVQSLIARTIKEFGRRTADFSDADLDAEVVSNLKSVWLCIKYELQQMQSQQPGGGVIVNMSSINGLGGAKGAALYSMSKAGILGLTKTAAQEYAGDGIRVNALVAGGFDTEMLQKAMSQAVGGDVAKTKRHWRVLLEWSRLDALADPKRRRKLRCGCAAMLHLM
jgi:NAD(P)-dependent dehydrogenase (short-subunit alcohol dehydrogenase family)